MLLTALCLFFFFFFCTSFLFQFVWQAILHEICQRRSPLSLCSGKSLHFLNVSCALFVCSFRCFSVAVLISPSQNTSSFSSHLSPCWHWQTSLVQPFYSLSHSLGLSHACHLLLVDLMLKGVEKFGVEEQVGIRRNFQTKGYHKAISSTL